MNWTCLGNPTGWEESDLSIWYVEAVRAQAEQRPETHFILAERISLPSFKLPAFEIESKEKL